jgi:hypothetical protein
LIFFGFGAVAGGSPFREDFLNVNNFGTISSRGVAAADFDGDGIEELFIVADTTLGEDPQTLIALSQENGALVVKGAFPLRRNTSSSLHVYGDGADRRLIVVPDAFAITDGMLEIFSNWPLTHQAAYPLPNGTRTGVVGDLDGDGEPELVLAGSSQIQIRRLFDGTLRWTIPFEASEIALAQLDADPALEIIPAGLFFGQSGRVFDGATGALEWSYSPGFGSMVAAGRIGANGTPGFVGARSEGDLTVFGVAPWSPSWTFAVTDTRALLVADVDGDQVDEILHARVWGNLVRIIDSQTRTVRHSLDRGVRALSTVRTPNLAGRSIVLSPPAIGGGSASGVSVVDPASGDVLSNAVGDSTGVAAVSVSEPLDSQPGKIFMADRGSGPSRMRVVDLASGMIEWTSPPVPIGGMADPFGFAAKFLFQTPLDSHPALELVAAGFDLQSGRVLVLDGQSRAVRVQIGNPLAGPLVGRDIAGATLVDFDGDQVQEVAVISHPVNTGATGVRIHVFSLLNGSLLWQSGTIGGADARARGLHFFRNLAGERLLIAALSDGLRAFDVASGALVWSHGIAVERMTVVPTSPDGPEFHIEGPASYIVAPVSVLDPETRVERRSYTLPVASRAVKPIPGQSLLVVADGRELRLRTVEGHAVGEPIRVIASRASDPLAIVPSNGGHTVVTGTPFGYVISNLVPDRVFGDSFDWR